MFAEHFSLSNIPYGIASSSLHPSRCVVTRLADKVIFLDTFAVNYGLSKELHAAVCQSTVNSLAALPKAEQQKLRSKLQSVLTTNEMSQIHCEDISVVELHLPVDVRGFTDFSSSREHCFNASEAMTNKRQLPPGFLHFPIGYTGRASSIVVSGTRITRPKGHFSQNGQVVYGPTQQLDYELEIAAVVGRATILGETVPVDQADEHIFGLVLMNDWSARDIQGLEMQPLGPMNGKSFATTIGAWVVTLDALASSEIRGVEKDVSVASYLQDNKLTSTYDIEVKADLVVDQISTTICRSNLKWNYWTLRELIAQQTANGCNLNTGDLLATGTISGTNRDSHGCLLELTRGGFCEFSLGGGTSRTWLCDGDTVHLTGQATNGVGFGECLGTIVPAR